MSTQVVHTTLIVLLSVARTAKVHLLQAQPPGVLHVWFAAIQVSPQALPSEHTLQQLSPPPPQPCNIGTEAVVRNRTPHIDVVFMIDKKLFIVYVRYYYCVGGRFDTSSVVYRVLPFGLAGEGQNSGEWSSWGTGVVF